MTQFINEFIAGLSTQFYIFQVVTILLMTLYGFLFMFVIRRCKVKAFDVLLAFPLSLSVYALSGYFLLSFGIPFNKVSILVVMILLLIICSIAFNYRAIQIQKSTGNDRFDVKSVVAYANAKNVFIVCAIIVIAALICTSGVLPVSATNDSMYFFQEYPRALIHYGKLVSYLDNFLTDASQGIAIIGTMPFFFGFDEPYGIMTFLNFNFIVLFVYAAYDLSSKKINKNMACIITVLSFFMLMTSMPFIIMSRWFMANMFFMEFMFIVVYLAYKFDGSTNYADLTVLALFITGLSIMRMEGALNAGFLVLCIMMLEYRNKDIALFMICPMLILQSMYLFRIFKIITLYCGYQFMTEQKAIILIAFLVLIFLYALVIRNRVFVVIQKYYRWILLAGFFALNILVFLYDRADYTTNIKAYIGNVMGNSGWGLFAPFVIGVLILVPKKSMKINYFDITTICFILLTIVAGWARGDTLYVSFGDSGNRILIQAVPLVLFVLIIKIVEGLEFWEKEKSDLME